MEGKLRNLYHQRTGSTISDTPPNFNAQNTLDQLQTKAKEKIDKNTEAKFQKDETDTEKGQIEALKQSYNIVQETKKNADNIMLKHKVEFTPADKAAQLDKLGMTEEELQSKIDNSKYSKENT